MNNLEKIKKILEEAAVNSQDTKTFLEVLTNAKDDELQIMKEILEDYPAHIPEFVKLTLKKQQALLNQDKQAWQKIIEEEMEFLKKIEKQSTITKI